MVLAKKCPIVDNLTVFLTLTAQTFSGRDGQNSQGCRQSKDSKEEKKLGKRKKEGRNSLPPTLLEANHSKNRGVPLFFPIDSQP